MERNGETIKMQSFDDLNTCGIRLLEENQANVDLELKLALCNMNLIQCCAKSSKQQNILVE